MSARLVLPWLVAAGLLAGCAANPSKLALGSSAESVRGTLGLPTGEYTLPEGGRRLEYARGPLGKQTWMLDFDARGGLVAVDQVLTERRFNQIRAGMTSEELKRELGRPSAISMVGWHQKQIVWSYRYETLFCQWFQVGIDPARGTVVDSAYLPDPICDDPQFTTSGLVRRR